MQLIPKKIKKSETNIRLKESLSIVTSQRVCSIFKYFYSMSVVCFTTLFSTSNCLIMTI